eukprot:CAMPEP_0174693972 /NCGR_PEP_ID=MMETSP1094-20130205/621_1 /TAXON_ID=156173 /ORGANISM="Chrysochromulina brevifilum, Strain UTEX LB 985" /LENGTH=338 /DNA_ID=CAMNT_0015890057 /DNA_START=30 /DNA_END=1046 /DNA_ORIENTATION=+
MSNNAVEQENNIAVEQENNIAVEQEMNIVSTIEQDDTMPLPTGRLTLRERLGLPASAPGSRLPSHPSSPRLEPPKPLASAPTSPRALRATRQIRSPTMGIRKATYHASFGSAPRELLRPGSTPCPVHSYTEMIPFVPKGGAIPFGGTRRPSSALPTWTEVHSYAPMTSTLKQTGSAVFARDTAARRSEAPRAGPNTHSYETMGTTLKRTGSAVFGSAPAPRQPSALTSSSSVAYYQPMRPMLRPNSAGSFPRAGREVYVQQNQSCGVHSYLTHRSTLKTSGVSSWGPPRKSDGLRRTASAANKLGAVPKLRAAVRSTSPSSVDDPLLEARRPAPIEVE